MEKMFLYKLIVSTTLSRNLQPVMQSEVHYRFHNSPPPRFCSDSDESTHAFIHALLFQDNTHTFQDNVQTFQDYTHTFQDNTHTFQDNTHTFQDNTHTLTNKNREAKICAKL